jgi:hypothetical protein
LTEHFVDASRPQRKRMLSVADQSNHKQQKNAVRCGRLMTALAVAKP